jgi:hypothetical protein
MATFSSPPGFAFEAVPTPPGGYVPEGTVVVPHGRLAQSATVRATPGWGRFYSPRGRAQGGSSATVVATPGRAAFSAGTAVARGEAMVRSRPAQVFATTPAGSARGYRNLTDEELATLLLAME